MQLAHLVRYPIAVENVAAYIEVIKQSGFILPSAGGIGTTIFFRFGAILVIGAGVVLVTRRMNAN